MPVLLRLVDPSAVFDETRRPDVETLRYLALVLARLSGYLDFLTPACVAVAPVYAAVGSLVDLDDALIDLQVVCLSLCMSLCMVYLCLDPAFRSISFPRPFA